MQFSFDPTRPPGERVRDCSVAGLPLDPGREYSVATADYLMKVHAGVVRGGVGDSEERGRLLERGGSRERG